MSDGLEMARRLLIAAGEAASHPEQLPFGVRELIDAAEEILVVTPTLPSRFEWLSSATDRAKEQADERLGLSWASSRNWAARPLARSGPTTPCSHSRTRSATSRPTTS